MEPTLTRKSKDQVARELAEGHAEIEPSISKVIRICGDDEGDDSEPIKLLQVNSETIPEGIIPIGFGPNEEVPFPLDIVEVTPEEFERILSKELPLPKGWTLGQTLFERKQ